MPGRAAGRARRRCSGCSTARRHSGPGRAHRTGLPGLPCTAPPSVARTRSARPGAAPLTVPGYLANDVHFENPDASGGNNSPRYATIYDIVTPDPATAWPDTEHSPAYPTQLFSDPRAKLVSPALRASYALVGSQLQPGEHGPLTGIQVILSNGGSDTDRQHQEAQILQTGLFYSAARFRIIEGSPEPAEWLEVFETDGLPAPQGRERQVATLNRDSHRAHYRRG